MMHEVNAMSDSNGGGNKLQSDLVAYLDGELSDRACMEIEQTLAENPRIRCEMELLERTWELLDTLPVSKASESFSQRTLSVISQSSMAAVKDQTPAVTTSRSWSIDRDTWLAAGLSMALTLTAILCFAVTNRWMPTETDRLVRDLPLLIKLEMYEEVSSPEYLNTLKQSRLFDDQSSSVESP